MNGDRGDIPPPRSGEAESFFAVLPTISPHFGTAKELGTTRRGAVGVEPYPGGRSRERVVRLRPKTGK
jgi:hypothetical protein